MAELFNSEDSILVVVDVQEKFLPVIHDLETVINNVVRLVKFSHICDIPVIVTEQYPAGLGRTVREIRELLPDNEPIEKFSFSCFGEDLFKKKLENFNRKKLIVVGIEAHVCVCQTVLQALENYRTAVVSDAVSSRTMGNREIGIERMKEAGAEIVSTEMIIFELLKKAGTDKFKLTLPLVK